MTPPRTFINEHLGRVTSSGRFIPEVDGLRFLAIAGVVFFHIFRHQADKGPTAAVYAPFDHPHHPFGSLLTSGSFGVHLFFIISGFILALPFAEALLDARLIAGQGRQVGLRDYYLRRLWRIEPPYLINVALCYFLRVVVDGASAIALLPLALSSVFYLHNTLFDYDRMLNGVWWSLEVEVQFYVVAPLLARLFAIRSSPMRRLAIVGVGLSGLCIGPIFPWRSLPNFIEYFMAGFLLADVYLVDWRRSPRQSWFWDVMGLAAVCMVPTVFRLGHHERLVMPVLLLIVCLAAFRGSSTHRLLRNMWLTTIGGMCYTIYLYHLLVIAAVHRLVGNLVLVEPRALNFFLVAVVIYCPMVLATCAALFVLFERPFMRRRKEAARPATSVAPIAVKSASQVVQSPRVALPQEQEAEEAHV